ncbi:unnamed protein product [Adineta ricciae]|uniref:Uncharacterized protein n=1 Tax=Adineta ricciae TaxID=249248 RepID=A0A814AUX1_ADIRI|nr:unnamed protein product [Adineta ricciae]CAF1223305.1 unnamed protein product [Adineta ricciae]
MIESGNSRITRWFPSSAYGVWIVGCTGQSEFTTNQLKRSHSLACDRNRSLYLRQILIQIFTQLLFQNNDYLHTYVKDMKILQLKEGGTLESLKTKWSEGQTCSNSSSTNQFRLAFLHLLNYLLLLYSYYYD